MGPRTQGDQGRRVARWASDAHGWASVGARHTGTATLLQSGSPLVQGHLGCFTSLNAAWRPCVAGSSEAPLSSGMKILYVGMSIFLCAVRAR